MSWLAYGVLGASMWIGNGLAAEIKRLCPTTAGRVSVALTALLAAPNLGPVFGPHALLSFGAASLHVLLRHSAAFVLYWAATLVLFEMAHGLLGRLWVWWKDMRASRLRRQGRRKPPHAAA